jgi:hypothetical protein
LQRELISGRQERRVGERARAVIDGPAPDHDLVLKARLAMQAPEIDGAVYLTDCDPSRYRPGDFLDVELIGAVDYDLIARPLTVV